jgi:hypothetical protein
MSLIASVDMSCPICERQFREKASEKEQPRAARFGQSEMVHVLAIDGLVWFGLVWFW